MRAKGERSNTTVCEACGTAVPSYDLVSYGSIDRGYLQLCTRCFNAEVAGVLGLSVCHRRPRAPCLASCDPEGSGRAAGRAPAVHSETLPGFAGGLPQLRLRR
jgi:hypothetical protein